jgi:hypothetical protein
VYYVVAVAAAGVGPGLQNGRGMKVNVALLFFGQK